MKQYQGRNTSPRTRPNHSGSRHLRKEETSGKKTDKPAEKLNIIPPLLSFFVRWAVVFALIGLVIGQINERAVTLRQYDETMTQYMELERERDDLLSELEQYRDENLTLSIWKWRTMSHEPGEYYIEFHE